jgi:hypothetical protein
MKSQNNLLVDIQTLYDVLEELQCMVEAKASAHDLTGRIDALLSKLGAVKNENLIVVVEALNRTMGILTNSMQLQSFTTDLQSQPTDLQVRAGAVELLVLALGHLIRIERRIYGIDATTDGRLEHSAS